MRIGLWIDEENRPVTEVGAAARAAQNSGVDRIWFSQRTGWDALTLIAGVAPLTETMRFAVGVVPVYPRHPLALAAQALSVQAVTGNRLTLGIGTSHPHMVEGMLGLSMEQPAKYMREYVEALVPLLAGEAVNYKGERLSAAGQIEILGAEAPVAKEVQRFADAGATELLFCPVGTPEEQARTIAFVHDYARR